MKKILLMACVFSASIIYGSAPAPAPIDISEHIKRKMLKNSNKHKSWRELFGPDWDTASEAEKVAMMKGAFANNRIRYDLLKITETAKILSQPKTLGAIALAAGGAFALWHASSLAKDLAKHYLLIPPLCDPAESSIRGWGSSIQGFFVHEDRTVPDRSQVVLSETLQKRFEKLSHAITNAAKNDVFFRHYLFYGPPGTGKTMVAKAIAQEAGLEYMYFSAANLEQYSLEEGIQQIRHLFEFAKAYPKKLMIVMDEADSIFAHRDTCSDKTRTFLNKILTYTGTEQNNYVVIAITNRPKDFDEAALSRFGVKIKVDAPGHKERTAIFAQYAQKYFVLSHTENRDKRSFFQWIFSRKPVERTPLNVADDVFTQETFNELADKSEGLSGREIADAMSNVQHDAYGTSDHTITKAMLFEALADKINDAEIMDDFKQKKIIS